MTYSNLFICYDGENTKDKYFLLGNSIDFIYDKKGLTSSKCFEFLTRKHKKKRIIFNLHYDLQFWVKDFSDKKILELFSGERVKYYNYELQYFHRKLLVIKKGNSTFKIYDILSFFQTSLLNLIDRLEIELSKEEKHILEKGKKLRSDFSKMTYDEIVLYNKTECIISEKIAGKIYNLMLNSTYKDKKGKLQNLIVQNFYGSSAISSKLLKSYEIGKTERHQKYIDYFIKSYYGGRFELLKIGKFKNIYRYDINSAYPFIIKDLRDVKRFIPVKKPKKIIDEGIYYIYYKQYFPSNFICPFPLRIKTGRIFYTGEVKGFYFGCEINAFLNSGCNKENYELEIYEGIIPIFGEKLFENKEGYNLIEEMYEQRKHYKNKKDLRHYIYKIALNSLYGKFAQKVGAMTYTNIYYASLITAKVRSMLLETSYKNDYSKIISFATDGIISEKKLQLKIDDKLGNWSEEKIKSGEILLSGLYRLNDENTKVYYGLRGYRLDLDKFDKIISDIEKKGKSFIKLSLFVTHKLAIQNYISYGKYRLQFIPIKKIIDVKNGNYKRVYFFTDNFNSKKSHYHIFEEIESIDLFDKSLLNNNDGLFDYY
jgi:hypothetical protein